FDNNSIDFNNSVSSEQFAVLNHDRRPRLETQPPRRMVTFRDGKLMRFSVRDGFRPFHNPVLADVITPVVTFPFRTNTSSTYHFFICDSSFWTFELLLL